MKRLMNYWILAVMAISIGVSSCSSDDEEEGEQLPVYELSIVNEADAKLDVDPEALTEQIIKIQTNAEQKDLYLEKENEQAWCTASVKSVTEIAVRAGANPNVADREAKFKLVAGASSVLFSVVQAGKNSEGCTLSIDSRDIEELYGSYMYTGDNSGQTLSVKINTTASRWKAVTADMMGEGDGSDWILIKNSRGKSGETMECALAPNVAGDIQSGSITISAGDAEEITIYINQMGMDAATSYKLFTDDKKTQEFKNGTALSFDATYSAEAKERIKTLYVETNGGYVALICESGSEDEVDDENSWLGAGGDLNELRINVKTNNTTGAERKLDVVIMDSNWDAELFRIPIVQKAN